ncbi:hypothetical protein DOTSEDRAFT_69651 [Dothistroma septosporum NZE10]|uniref:Long-chain-alcohol oxidase n=1 Tax=Dothistroma septosporum (strain NZE10 / CBS 128990) TaxID=675120 RepID=N1PXR0_DOTSN|nr:hypothetical protein DOTSEDRAFT_69651 [Dothistroma septosporum NZE10]
MSALPIEATPAPLPPLPTTDPCSAEQWRVFSAIVDVVTPSFTPSKGNRLLQHPLRRDVFDAAAKRIQSLANLDANNADLATAYLGESATAQPELRDSFTRLITLHMSDTSRNGLLFILNALNTRAGALLLTGHATAFDCLPIQDREQILLGWANARLPFLRQLHRSLVTLARVLWIRTSPTIGELLAYPKIPINAGPAGAGFPYRFVQIPPAPVSAEPEVIETDVVIVGSGCGGAVVAKTLAEAGLKVLVVEKSYYWPPEYFPMSDNEAQHLYGNGGAIISNDASITVVAGSTFGGGGTINWSASLQPQGIVRREWAYKFGLTQFNSSEFQADLDYVCDRMGVSTAPVKHNKANIALLEGARKLGWSAKPVAQNTGGEEHSDGFCTRGCRDCGKKGPTITWLPDAASAGASFMEGFDVKEVVFDDTESGDRQAIGVKGIWTSRDTSGGMAGLERTTREVIVKARRTIISGGSMYTPLLLQRSGLKNKHIGRHLHLHPVSMLAAVWDEDVRPWEGPILTSVVNEFENLDGDGYGAKLECTTMIPGSFLAMFPWTGGLAFKEFAIKMRKMTGYISLARDRYGGRVYSDADGRCMVQYSPNTYDKNHILEGIARMAEIVYVEGAREIHAAIPGIEPFVRADSGATSKVSVHANQAPSLTDIEFKDWLAKLRKNGFPAPGSGFFSAHQMGSCRMGTSPKNSAVDHRGRVWGTKGLYVADASVFPSASGVNPMITCMGIARGIARAIVDEVKRSDGSTGKLSPRL